MEAHCICSTPRGESWWGLALLKALTGPAVETQINFLLPVSSQCYLSTHVFEDESSYGYKTTFSQVAVAPGFWGNENEEDSILDQWNSRNCIDFMAPHPLLESRRTSRPNSFHKAPK